jgi:hypothetical protein
VIVSVPRLVYYAITGRYFLAEISITGFQDFINGIQGEIPKAVNYTEYSLEAIIDEQAKILVQSTIYQDDVQSQILRKMEVATKVISWLPPEKLVGRVWLWLIAWFWKPIDIVILSYQHPEIYALNLAKRVYYFTGNGYLPVSINPFILMKAVIKTLSQMSQIYWQIRKLKIS